MNPTINVKMHTVKQYWNIQKEAGTNGNAYFLDEVSTPQRCGFCVSYHKNGIRSQIKLPAVIFLIEKTIWKPWGLSNDKNSVPGHEQMQKGVGKRRKWIDTQPLQEWIQGEATSQVKGKECFVPNGVGITVCPTEKLPDSHIMPHHGIGSKWTKNSSVKEERAQRYRIKHKQIPLKPVSIPESQRW
jgi:hypothetical protein